MTDFRALIQALASSQNQFTIVGAERRQGPAFHFDEATLRAGLNFTLSTSAGAIDLPGEITGAGDYRALLPHTAEAKLYGASWQQVRPRIWRQ